MREEEGGNGAECFMKTLHDLMCFQVTVSRQIPSPYDLKVGKEYLEELNDQFPLIWADLKFLYKFLVFSPRSKCSNAECNALEEFLLPFVVKRMEPIVRENMSPALASTLSFLLLTADSIVDLDALSAHRSAEWALFV